MLRERERKRKRERACSRMKSRKDERSEILVIIFDIKAPVMVKYLQQQKKEILNRDTIEYLELTG
jgi:C4-type Zn-finger protein